MPSPRVELPRTIRQFVIASAIFANFATATEASYLFTPIGVAGSPHEASFDGSVVVGFANSFEGNQSFYYTRGVGPAGLGDLPYGGANGTSADGSVIVGTYRNSNSRFEAYRWTAADGIVGMGYFEGAGSDAAAVSADGSVITGSSLTALGPEVYRWTAATGMVKLGDLPGGQTRAFAYDISADGSVIVGHGTSDFGKEAFRWTEADGMVGLGDLPGRGFQSHAYAVSSDGSVIVGWSESDNSPLEAFRWTEADGMVGLGTLVPTTRFGSRANGVSGDGSIIVGTSTAEFGSYSQAFIWTEESGMLNLRDMLVANGVNLDGWTLIEATGISEDGTTIFGYGVSPNGTGNAAWVVTAIVPETSTFVLTATGVLCISFLRRKTS